MSERDAPARVVAAASEFGISVEVVTFPDGTRTAADAAAAIGCEVAAICKSLVVTTDDGPALVLCSGAKRLDETLVGRALDRSGVRMATPDEARNATGFPIGGTPPFGHAIPLPVLADRDLLDHETVWAAAGTPQAVFPIPPGELLRASGARTAEVAA
ncbi:YbaK/EbsC family protein [Egibacter rhizosphaerae]|uniref:YbaK/EbsC family protein n=1 Tax=Egibacter rhizosphaerae TaxID=1670831 RepID=A0A411YI84_9ACTN|nr:YbaK/EbsC family protein [Egibacter rhizosphaerae]QBI20988.1 YbaK/EbsC family protein [Egibacter rhizosphaerae]